MTEGQSYDEVTTSDPWSERGVFTYEPLLADGTGSLPMGEPGYFTDRAPHVAIRFVWTLDDAQAERVTALADLTLRVDAPASAGRAAWAYEEPLARGVLEGNAQDPLALAATIDLPAAMARVAQTPGRDVEDATWSVRASVRFASAPLATHKADASEFTLPISYSPPLYSLPSAADAAHLKDHTRTQLVHHEEGGGAGALVANPVGPALVLLGVGLLVAIARSRAPPEASA